MPIFHFLSYAGYKVRFCNKCLPGNRLDELTDFVNNAKTTFGAFQVQVDDGDKHYFLISIKL